jgi:SAM-dependent methyltransferase
LQIAAIPVDLSRYYGGDYYSFGAPVERSGLISLLYRARDGYAFTGHGWLGRMLYSFFPRHDYRFLSRLKLSKSDRILDVGCGAGALLQALRHVGFEKLTGLDPFIKSNIHYPNGVVVHKTVLDEFSEPQKVVMFNHSLEHMPDQRQALANAARLITADGVVIARVPTVSSFAWQHYGTEWVQIDAPRHLFLHSRESMSITAAQAGLEVFDHVYDSESFQFWGSEQCKQGIPLIDDRSYAKNPKTSLFQKSEIDHFKKIAVELNGSDSGDQVAFFMRRRAA